MNFLAEYYAVFTRNKSSKYIQNLNTTCEIIHHREHEFPITINTTEYSNTYVCSLYTALVSYGKEELVKIPNKVVRFLVECLINGFSRFLKLIHINQVVQINNWLLSTNLFQESSISKLDELTKGMISKYPRHMLMVRSLNAYTNADLLEQFKQQGYICLPTRQVYIFDGNVPVFLRRHNNVIDRNLLNNSAYKLVSHDEIGESDYAIIYRLYAQLYIDKYSKHNPAFSEALIKHWHQTKTIEMFGLRDSEGTLQGILGLFSRQGVITAPLVGYNTQLPQKLGLYRMLMNSVIELCVKRRQVLNLSSGASHFKRLRGGVPHIEYAVLYVDHLPWFRRIGIKMICCLVGYVGVPIMRKYQL